MAQIWLDVSRCEPFLMEGQFGFLILALSCFLGISS